ncbi:MAG: hypothetical protein KDH95_24565, partial [Calditrichaeota bacterium]|nr:hypothetical protein [Calditrichota bacterium]
VAESVRLQKRLWAEMTDLALERVREAGVTIVRPDKTPFREAVQPIYDDLAGSELGMWAERIRSLPPEPDTTAEDAQ